jgi:hypothetical protein
VIKRNGTTQEVKRVKTKRGKKGYAKLEDISKEDTKRILDFLNATETAGEIADAVESSERRDIVIKVAQNILDERDRLGGFKDIREVIRVPQVGSERFTELAYALREEIISRVEISHRRPDEVGNLLFRIEEAGLQLRTAFSSPFFPFDITEKEMEEEIFRGEITIPEGPYGRRNEEGLIYVDTPKEMISLKEWLLFLAKSTAQSVLDQVKATRTTNPGGIQDCAVLWNVMFRLTRFVRTNYVLIPEDGFKQFIADTFATVLSGGTGLLRDPAEASEHPDSVGTGVGENSFGTGCFKEEFAEEGSNQVQHFAGWFSAGFNWGDNWITHAALDHAENGNRNSADYRLGLIALELGAKFSSCTISTDDIAWEITIAVCE